VPADDERSLPPRPELVKPHLGPAGGGEGRERDARLGRGCKETFPRTLVEDDLCVRATREGLSFAPR